MSDPLFARYGREYRAADVLFREGEPGTAMYVIQEGVVQVLRRIGGEERPIATLSRGEFVGEMALLNGRPRNASAICLEDTRCLVIDAKTLEGLIARSPEVAVRLISRLAKRLDASDQMIQILLDPDPKARLLLGLKRQAEVGGEVAAYGVRLNLSSEDLAREVGIDPGDAEDVLARLRRMQIIGEDEVGSLVLRDMERLLEFFDLLQMPRKFEGS